VEEPILDGVRGGGAEDGVHHGEVVTGRGAIVGRGRRRVRAHCGKSKWSWRRGREEDRGGGITMVYTIVLIDSIDFLGSKRVFFRKMAKIQKKNREPTLRLHCLWHHSRRHRCTVV
jgi:hypothetical protein